MMAYENREGFSDTAVRAACPFVLSAVRLSGNYFILLEIIRNPWHNTKSAIVKLLL